MKIKELIFDKSLLRFLLVGSVNTLFGLALQFAFYNFLALGYWLSSFLAYVISSVLSYILNRNYTFGHKGSVFWSIIRFSAVILGAYIIAYSLAKPFVFWVLKNIGLRLDDKIAEQLAMLFGMCLFVGLNYLGQRFFCFRKEQKETKNGK